MMRATALLLLAGSALGNEINSQSAFDEVMNSGKNVLVKYQAPW